MEYRHIRHAPAARRGTAAASERRRCRRVSECPPLSVSGLAAAVYDVSRNGICLMTRTPLGLGERCGLVLEDAVDHSSLAVTAEVVWCGNGRAGLSWVDLTPEQDRWLAGRFQVWFRLLDGASRR